MATPNRAFTLIELLVVISIIGLISSVALASLNTARAKGNLAAARRFSSQFNHALSGSALVMPFEQGTASSTVNHVDNSVAAISGSPTWSTDTPSGKGLSLSLNGSNTYLTGSIPASTFASDFTITAWFKRNTMTTWGAIFSNSVGTSDTAIMTMRNQTNQFGIMRVGITEVDGTYVDLGSDMDGKWIFGVVQRRGNTLNVYAYKDGKLIQNSGTLSWTLNATSQYYIGRHYQSAVHIFNGLIDDVNVYAEALPLAEIQKIYAQGADRLFALDEDK